jgi:hypothetical protein
MEHHGLLTGGEGALNLDSNLSQKHKRSLDANSRAALKVAMLVGFGPIKRVAQKMNGRQQKPSGE